MNLENQEIEQSSQKNEHSKIKVILSSLSLSINVRARVTRKELLNTERRPAAQYRGGMVHPGRGEWGRSSITHPQLSTQFPCEVLIFFRHLTKHFKNSHNFIGDDGVGILLKEVGEEGVF